MPTPLIDSLNAVANPEFADRVASQLGEQPDTVRRGLHGGIAALLGGLLVKTGDPTAVRGILSTVTDNVNDGNVLDNPVSLLDANGAASPMLALGGHFTSGVFGARTPAVTAVVARSSGLRVGSASTLLRLAAPLVLGALVRRVRAGGLDAASFANAIAIERDSIVRAAPPGLTEALGTAERVPRRDFETEREFVPVREPSREYQAVEEKATKRKVWPIVAAVGALALLFALWPKGRGDRTVEAPRQEVAGGEVVPPAVTPPAITPPAITPPAIPGITLPGGTVVIADPGSPEERIVGFLKAPGAADRTTWFVLDRMQFATNSATLSPESDAQVKNLGQILKAYPNARVRIGGYTDNVGSESANRKLSRERANSVRRALIDAGASADRVTAEGYGSKDPIADNSTEAGRAQNRRISLLVVRK